MSISLAKIAQPLTFDGLQQAVVVRDAIGELQRVGYARTATKRRHERLRSKLLAESAIDKLFTFRNPEDD